MKYVDELVQIYNILELIEAQLDVKIENMTETLTLLMQIRGVVAHTFDKLEELKNAAR